MKYTCGLNLNHKRKLGLELDVKRDVGVDVWCYNNHCFTSVGNYKRSELTFVYCWNPLGTEKEEEELKIKK